MPLSESKQRPCLSRLFSPQLAAIALVLSCSACSLLPQAKSPARPEPPRQPTTVLVPTPSEQEAQIRNFIAYQITLSKMAPADLAREIARRGDNPVSMEDAMNLALALGIQHGTGDLARAQGLLNRVLSNETPQAHVWHNMAHLLSTLYAGQRRSDEQVDRLNQQLRDTQHKLDQANEKLEAIKSIESSLNSRIPVTGKTVPKP